LTQQLLHLSQRFHAILHVKNATDLLLRCLERMYELWTTRQAIQRLWTRHCRCGWDDNPCAQPDLLTKAGLASRRG
jgi:hypothetical protein